MAKETWQQVCRDVATKIMGWTVGNPEGDFTDAYFDGVEWLMYCTNFRPCGPKVDANHTDRLIEAMEGHGYSCRRETGAIFEIATTQVAFWVLIDHDKFWQAWDNSIHLAVCRCALDAKANKVETA